jgi:hypothetical protein
MNEIERLREKIIEKYPKAKAEIESFKSGMQWLDVWLEEAESNERKCWSIVEWNSSHYNGFGFADMSNPDDDRHVFESRMDEYGLDFDVVFQKVCEVLDGKVSD